MLSYPAESKSETTHVSPDYRETLYLVLSMPSDVIVLGAIFPSKKWANLVLYDLLSPNKIAVNFKLLA